VVCHLTGLEDLKVYCSDSHDGLLLHLTQLQQLTELSCYGPFSGGEEQVDLMRWVSRCELAQPLAVLQNP
jgi:hypothetical protein